MVRESPTPDEYSTMRESRRAPRRAIAALVVIVAIAMLWTGIAGYIWVVLLGAAVIVAILVYFVAASAGSTPRP